MTAPLEATPSLDAALPSLPGTVAEDAILFTAFDDDEVAQRRVYSQLDEDRFGLEALFVPGWAAMDEDERTSCALSLVLTLGDDLCERHLGADTTLLTMTLDDIGDEGEAALRRFAVSNDVKHRSLTLFGEILVADGTAFCAYALVPAAAEAHERALVFLESLPR